MSKQKYEQEIEDILRKYDEEKGKREKSSPAEASEAGKASNPSPRPPIDFRAAQARRPSYSRAPQRSGFTMPNWKRLSAAQYIGLAIGAAVLAVLIRGVPFLSGALVIASVVLFFIPFVLYKSTGTTSGGYSPTEEKRWRGQPIDYNPRKDNDDDDPLAGIKRWFRRR